MCQVLLKCYHNEGDDFLRLHILGCKTAIFGTLPKKRHYKNRVRYSEMLGGPVQTNYSYRTPRASMRIGIMHDNARLQIPARSVGSLRQVSFQTLKNFPYSHVTPSDHQPLGSLKDALRGRHFDSDHEVKAAAHAWPIAE